MRGSDPDAAVYYLARMLYAGEDIKFISRRIMICAAEDVGNAESPGPDGGSKRRPSSRTDWNAGSTDYSFSGSSPLWRLRLRVTLPVRQFLMPWKQ